MAEEGHDYFSNTPVNGIGVELDNVTPFQPQVEIVYGGNDSPESFDVTFNQGYIFNRVSHSQLDRSAAVIGQMQQVHNLPLDVSKKYYVEVVIDRENFLITRADFTGFDAAEEQPETQFPEIIFEQLENQNDTEPFTGYFPVLSFVEGVVDELTLRDNINLSDRQFKQLGLVGVDENGDEAATNSAHILVSGGKESQSNPVRVRAIQGTGDITVTETDKYILISGSGETAVGASCANIGSAAEIYEDGSSAPFEFRTLTGNAEQPDNGQNNTDIFIDPTSADRVLISGGHSINVEGGGGTKVYVDNSIRPFKFRGIAVAGSNLSIGYTSVGSTNDTVLITHTEPSHSTPNLQEVTDEGSTTSNSMGADSLSIGDATYRSTTPPTNGAYVKGQVGLGTNSLGGFTEKLFICGDVRIKDGSTPADGKLYLGNGTQSDIRYDGSETALKLGAGITQIKFDHSDTVQIAPNSSITIGAGEYPEDTTPTIYNSPATGSVIIGGSGNYISGNYNVIVAGIENMVTGGSTNFIGGGSGIDIASSEFSVSVGGRNNDISGSNFAVIGGGFDNLISGSPTSTIAGGQGNEITGEAGGSIGGGNNNKVHNKYSSIVGGQSNEIKYQLTDGGYNFIGAGVSNTISGAQNTIAGGNNNTVIGSRSTTLGGAHQEIKANDAVTAGNYSKVQQGHQGAFVFSDSIATPALSSGANTMLLDFKSGVYVTTDSGLYINGNAVLTGETPEGDTLDSVTDRGNTTTNNIKVNTLSGSFGMIDVGLAIGPAGSPHTGPRYGLDCEESAFLGGTTIISGNVAGKHTLEISGDAGGTGFGGRLTLGGTGYLLSGDVAGTESDTLQTVTDRGATTTNDITVADLLVQNNGQVRANGAGSLTLGNTNGGTIYVSGTSAKSIITPRVNHLYLQSNRDEDDIIFQAGEADVEMARFDSENQRFGIGTVSPQSRLHVGNATGNSLGLIFTNPTETVRQYFADDSTDSDFFITYDGNGGAEITLQHDGKLALNASNGDNVGVGTVNPRTSLHVSRAGTTEGAILTIDNPNNSDGSYCGIEFINSTVGYPRSAIFAQRTGGYDAELTFHTSPTNEITGSDYPAATERMRIDHDGNVGIGTDDPSAELEIASSVPTLRLKDSDLTDHYTDIEKAGVYTYLYSRANAANGGFIFLGTAGSTDTEFMRIDTAGQVGIGVTDPDTKLEVDGNIKISAGKFYRIAGNEYQVGTDGVPSRLQLHAGGSERISISGDGKVGIGTTVPESLVHIYGGNSTQTFSNINAGLAIENAGSSASHYVFQTATAGGGKSFSITNAGNVGIGTTNPTEKLEVAPDTDVSAVIGKAHVGFMIGGDYAGFAHIDNASSASYALLQSAGGDTYLNCDNGNQLFFRKNNSTLGGFNSSSDFYVDTDTLFVDASANSVGIRDSTPSYPLDVNGIIRTQSGLLGTQFGTGPCTTIDGFFASTSTEDYGFQNALLMNDLAGFTKWAGVTIATSGLYKTRGGSAGSYTYSNEAGTGDFDRAFQANNHTIGSWYTDSGPDGDITTGVASTGVIELYFNGVKSLNYSAQAAIIFGSNPFRATHVKIEALRTGAWQTILDTTENTKTALIARIASNAGGANATTGLRYSFAKAGSYFRINNLYAADYDLGNDLSYGGQYYIDKYYDGRHYSTLYPVTNGGADLGKSSNKYDVIYGNSGNFTNGITVNGNPVVTGTSAFESDTLQTVTDEGNITTNNIIIENNGNDPEYGALTISGGYALAHLRSTGTVAYLQFQNSTTSYGTMSNVGMTIGNNGHDAYVTNRQALGSVYLATSGEARVAIKPDGDVGIGSITPQGLLDVKADTDQNVFLGRARFGSHVTDYLYLSHYDNATSTSYALKQSPAGSSAINAKAGQNVSMSVNNSNIVFVQGSTSRVGIGTTGPAELLHVDGNILIPQGKTLKGYYGGSIPVDIIGMSSTTDTHIYGGNNNSSDIFFDTCNGGTTGTRMTITNAGNVGIGTTDPSKPLQVVGGISGEDIILDGGSSSDMAIQFAGSNNGIYCDPLSQMRFAVDSASSAMVLSSTNIQFGGGGNSKLSWSTNNYLEFNGGGTKARLNSIGLGIGTTDPVYDLTIGGNAVGSTGGLRINDPSNAAYGAHFSFADTPNEVRIGGITNNVYNDAIGIYRESTRTITIDSSQRVGIGTTNPAQKLHLEFVNTDTGFAGGSGGDWGSEGILIENTSETTNTMAMIQLRNYDADIHIAGIRQASNDSDLGFFFEGSEKVRFTKGGNVGIGTTDPSEKLAVSGNILVTGAGSAGPHLKLAGTYTTWEIENQYAGGANNDMFRIRNTALGSDALVINRGNNRVGVGITAPTAALHVNGDGGTAAKIENGSLKIRYPANNDAITITPSVGNEGRILASDGDTSTPHPLKIGGDYVRITTSGVSAATEVVRFTAEGNVGIGTTDPDTKLHLQSGRLTIAGNGSEAIKVTNSDIVNFDLSTVRADLFRASAISDQLEFRGGSNRTRFLNSDGGTELFTITNAGNVGIGSNSPAVELDVVGTGDFDSVRILNSTQTLNPRLILGRDINQNIQFHVVDNDCTITADQDSDSDGDHKFILNRTFAGAGENDFQIAKDGTAQVTVDTDGRVGIGSASPSFVLDTVFAGDNGARLRSTDNHSSLTVQSHASYGAYLRFSDGGNRYWLQARSDDKLQFRPNASLLESACIYFDETGNVGIGVSNPSTKLEVVGPKGADGVVTIGDTTSVAAGVGGEIDFEGVYQGTTRTVFGSIEAKKTNATAGHYGAGLALSTRVNGGGGLTERLTILESGNVGIGQTSPSAKLQVNGDVRVEGSSSLLDMDANAKIVGQYYANGESELTFLRMYNGSDASINMGTKHAAGYISFAAGNGAYTERMRIENDGDVGIGTTVPTHTLHVKAQKDGDYVSRITNTEATAGANFGLKVDGGSNASDVTFEAQSLAGTSYFKVQGDGKVGIGSSSPSYELDVNGTTRSTYYVGGAYLEENASSSKLKFYTDGTVLVMDEDGGLKPCEKENDTLVFGVTKKDFDSPVVLGAEPVLVTGPIKVGDYIVTSNKQGHGQSMKEQNIGTIIAQAMESGDGESYNIKAMVRKM